MTLYTSQSKNVDERRRLAAYMGVTIFCGVVFLVYDRFSHGVRSPYMIFLFAWPLLLGCLPSLILILAERLPALDNLSKDIYNTGVGALTLSSLLKGVFDIAGTASDYQKYLMFAGIILVIAGIAVYLFRAGQEPTSAAPPQAAGHPDGLGQV